MPKIKRDSFDPMAIFNYDMRNLHESYMTQRKEQRIRAFLRNDLKQMKTPLGIFRYKCKILTEGVLFRLAIQKGMGKWFCDNHLSPIIVSVPRKETEALFEALRSCADGGEEEIDRFLELYRKIHDDYVSKKLTEMRGRLKSEFGESKHDIKTTRETLLPEDTATKSTEAQKTQTARRMRRGRDAIHRVSDPKAHAPRAAEGKEVKVEVPKVEVKRPPKIRG